MNISDEVFNVVNEANHKVYSTKLLEPSAFGGMRGPAARLQKCGSA